MKNASLRAHRSGQSALASWWLRAGRTWASSLTLGLLVAMVLMACGADTLNNGGAGGARETPSTPAATAALRASLSAQPKTGNAAYRFARGSSGGVTGKNAAHELDVTLADGAVGLARSGDGAWHLGLRWTGLGRGARIAEVARPAGGPSVRENRASYLRRDDSEEWYESGPQGVEQGFVLAAPPPGARSEALAIEVSVEGDLSPVLADGGAGIDLDDARGATVAHYTDLSAFDAGGAVLRSWIEVAGGVVRLRVDDAGARYPLTIDPVVWTLQQELTASDGATSDELGTSVSVSGAIAIVGAPNHTVGANSGAGAAYVFVQSGTTWSLQQELTAADGAALDGFGTSVSVSGAIAIVGAPSHTVGANSGAGAAYVFVQSGTTWTLQQELTASDAAGLDGFGTSVSVSGAIVVVGAPDHTVGSKAEAGAAYAFAQSGTTWTQQQELTGADEAAFDGFGTSVSVSVSTSGTSALVGSPFHTVGSVSEAGAAYAFAQSGTTWGTPQELVADDGAAFDGFGTSVSVSGPNALVGSPFHTVGVHSEAGAAYVFAESGTSWTLQQKLTAADGQLGDVFGTSVSMSGSMAIVGAYQHDVGGTVSAGAAYLYFDTCPTWTLQQELTATDKAISDFFGYSVAVGGTTAIVGAYNHDVGAAVSAGAAYVYNGVLSTAAACCISGTLFAAGTVDPANACLLCTPALATTSWSDEPNGTACSDGNACTQTDSCQAGVCVGSNPVTCVASDQCHTSTCNPSTGVCVNVSVPNGTACNDGDACTQTDTCQAGVCTGSNPVVCKASDQCHTAGTCNTGTGICSNPSAANGTSCNDGNGCTQTDTCQAGVCTGSNPVVCTASDQCHTAGTCSPSTGVCSNPSLPDGSTCSDGNGCTQTDTCQAGVCTGSNPVTCTASDQCHVAGTCNPGTGVCSNPPATNGTSCNDGNSCTQTDTCQAGVCTGSNPVTCAASDQCHTAGTCNPSTGACSNPSLPDGSTCSDGNGCTQTDICQAGVCTGSNPVVCTASDQCHVAGTCNPGTGTCSNPPVANGTACNDGNACTQIDTCQAGVCAGSSPVVCVASDQCHAAGICDPTAGICTNPNLPDGSSCNDGSACTQTDACQAGVCTGSNPVICMASDQCHAAGTCDPTSGTCSNPSAADGTSCDDGNGCTQTDACQAGVCMGSNPVTCAASDQCHAAGTCDPTSGTCSNPSAADGTSCDDGNGCTQTDACQAGVCTGSNPVTCTASDVCHVAGSCDMGTGTCSNPNAPDGTVCPEGTCQGGTCTVPSTTSSSSSSSSGAGTGGSSTGTGGAGSSSSGAGTGGAGTSGSSSSGAGGASTSGSGGTGGSEGLVASGGGCNCEMSGEPSRTAWLLGALPLLLLRRRRVVVARRQG